MSTAAEVRSSLDDVEAKLGVALAKLGKMIAFDENGVVIEGDDLECVRDQIQHALADLECARMCLPEGGAS